MANKQQAEQATTALSAADVQKMIEASLLPIMERLGKLERYKPMPVTLETGDIIDRAREAARQEAETARRLASIEKKIEEGLKENEKKIEEGLKENEKKIEEQKVEIDKRLTSLEEGLKKDVAGLKEEASKSTEKLEQISEVAKKAVEEHRRAIDWDKEVLAEFSDESLTEEQIKTLEQVEDILREKGWLVGEEEVRASAKEAQA